MVEKKKSTRANKPKGGEEALRFKKPTPEAPGYILLRFEPKGAVYLGLHERLSWAKGYAEVDRMKLEKEGNWKGGIYIIYGTTGHWWTSAE